MSYTIRPTEEKDLPSIYQFICLLEETSFDRDVFESIFNKNIHNPDYYYRVAVSERNDVIGFISCHMQSLLHHCGNVAEIQELYVHNKCRGMGIGKALINAVETALIQAGCLSYEVTAQNKREATHQFYEANGFMQSHKKFVKSLS